MSNRFVTRKRSYSLDHGGASFIEDAPKARAQSLDTTEFGGRKVDLPLERGVQEGSHRVAGEQGEESMYEHPLPQHDLMQRHSAHHDLSANKVNVVEEKSKPCSQRFRLSSINPLSAVYKVAKRIGQFFRATASGFFSGVTRIVGMKWSTESQPHEIQKSYFSESDSEREGAVAMRSPSFIKHDAAETEELRVTNKETALKREEYSRLREGMEQARRERPSRPEEHIPKNTSSLKEMEAKRRAFIAEINSPPEASVIEDPDDLIKPVIHDEDNPITDRGIVEL